jgi:predicted DNA-binding transcriptional regulator AlpA
MSEKIFQKLAKEPEAARYIEMSRPWLRLQRMRGDGPPYVRLGRAIRYDLRDLDAWLETKKVN